MAEARDGLMATFGLSQVQAQAILDMQLQRLTGLERQKIVDELTEVLALIERLRAILASDALLMQIVVDELREVRDRFGDARRTEIVEEEGEFRIEDLIADEDMAITVSNTGYIKRTAVSNYRTQRRGGQGRKGMSIREEDVVSHLFIASTHAYILIFSDKGRVYWLKVYEIPDVGPDGKGKAIANLVSMLPDEKIAALLAVKEFEEGQVRRDGDPARRGQEDRPDRLPEPAGRRHHRHGRGRRRRGDGGAVERRQRGGLHRDAGRDGHPVPGGGRALDRPGRLRGRGITLREDDAVVAMEVVTPGGTLLTVSENGYGKRTDLDEYRVQSRGGLGIINIHTTDRNGRVVGIAYVRDEDELMLITEQGKILRMVTRDVRTIGRATQGVRLIGVDEDDRVVSIARLAEREEDLNE